MADVTIDSGAETLTNERDALHGPYWTSTSVGYVVSQEAINDLEVWKTDDSGATWATQDAANEPTSANNRSMAVWYDKETPDNTGTIIHIAFVRTTDNDVRYVAFDTAADTYGTIRTVDALTVSGTSADSDVSVTCAKSGKVYVCARGDFEQDTENTDHSMRSSTDGFATNNESEASPYTSSEELVKLFPGADADEDDICMVFYQATGTAIRFGKFDSSANSWGLTTVDTDIPATASVLRGRKGNFDACIRHSDDHILVVYYSDINISTGDFRCADITQATPTITGKTNLHTDVADSSFPAILINQINDDVYVAYAGSDDDTEALGADIVVYFKKSDDGMGTWGTEQTYGVQADDHKATSLGRTIGNDGGRIMPVWFNDDLVTTVVNDGNDVEIAASGVAWKAVAGAQINIGDVWKTITAMQINIGDSWKAVAVTDLQIVK